MANEGKNIIGPIFITKVLGRAFDCTAPCIPGFFTTPRTTEIRNLANLVINTNTPLERFSIPESTDDKSILIKVMGNQSTITITWTLLKEATNIVKQALTGREVVNCDANGYVGGIIGGDTTATDNQLKWWTTIFQPNSIFDRYNLYLGDCATNPIPNTTPTTRAQEEANFKFSRAYHKEGTIQDLLFVKTGTTPVTYEGTMVFYVGDIQTEPNEEAPA